MISKQQFEANVNLMNEADAVNFNNAAPETCVYNVSGEYGDGLSGNALNDTVEYADENDDAEVMSSNENLVNFKVGKKTPC